MTIDWNNTQSKTTIERLTVRYHGERETLNASSLRRRIEQLLSNIDLQPSGFSSGALLFIRKIQGLAPLPTNALVRSTQTEREQWVEQVQSQMAILYATATRPAQQQVPANANAVLFHDCAEMLVCLTRDILNGQAWQRWYWQRMLATIPRFPAAALTALWSAQSAFLPATLSTLRPQEAYTALALLSSVELQQVIHAVCANFDVPVLAFDEGTDSLSESMSPSSNEQSFASNKEKLYTSPLSSEIVRDDSQVRTREEQVIAPPWQRWLADGLQFSIVPEAQYLFGLSLTLYHAPVLAKSVTFAQQTTVWLQSYKHATRNTHSIEPNTYISTVHADKDLMPSASNHSETERMASSASLSADVPAMPTADMQSVLEGSTLTTSPTSEVVDHEGVLHIANSILTQEPTTLSATGDVTREFTVTEARPLPTDGMTTQLGGILYLINLLPLLTARMTEDICADYLSAWGVIEVLAKGLLGTLYTDYIDDPMWDVLASLDGRRDGFNAPSTEATTDENTLPVGTASARPPVASITNQDALKRPLQIIQEAYRLLIGLLNEPNLEMGQVAEMVLCKYGRLIVSRTHVDLFMSMEEISLPVRRAGLDRDPGWVPDLARIVLFHFD